MFERIQRAAKAFLTTIPGPWGAAAKAFYGNHPNSINYPSTAVALGNVGKKDIAGIINNLPISQLRDYQSYLLGRKQKSLGIMEGLRHRVEDRPRNAAKDYARRRDEGNRSHQ